MPTALKVCSRRALAFRLVVFMGAVALAACLDERVTGPHHGGLAQPPEPTASRIGSPDELEMAFGSREATYGKVATGPGPRLKYATVYEVTVYDYARQVRNIPDAPIEEADPLPLNATLFWTRGAGLDSSRAER